jgi:hypothetical protein
MASYVGCRLSSQVVFSLARNCKLCLVPGVIISYLESHLLHYRMLCLFSTVITGCIYSRSSSLANWTLTFRRKLCLISLVIDSYV